MRRYETIYVLRPDLGEAPMRQAARRIEEIIIHGGGELVETDEWGIRELAYRIKRERRGYYVRLDYVAPTAAMNEVERNLKLMDEVLRFLSVMVEEEADAAALRNEIEARQQRLAEARAAAAAASAAQNTPAADAAPSEVPPAEPAPSVENQEPASSVEAEGGENPS